MEANESSSYHFDVALSFAGEDRSYVEQVATALKAAGIVVFYDADYKADTWGEDLVEYFDEVYRLVDDACRRLFAHIRAEHDL